MSTPDPLPPPRFRPRVRDSNKGDSGRMLVISGAVGWAGAPVLVARGAIATGIGLLTVAVPETIRAEVATAVPEAMVRGLRATIWGTFAHPGVASAVALADERDACVIGPGISTADDAGAFVLGVLERITKPCVIDADALNVVAATGRLSTGAPTIITPHPGEAARLLGKTTAQIQADRVAAAHELHDRFGGVVVLKGAGTIVTDGSRTGINPTGNPGLARGGSGDVLAGVIGACCAAGLAPFDAAAAGVYLHGDAADAAARDHGERGLTIAYLIDALPGALRRHEG